MVESTVVGITPAQHADQHRTGGSDPLTGEVGITPHETYSYDTNIQKIFWANDPAKSCTVGMAVPEKIKETLIEGLSGFANTTIRVYYDVTTAFINGANHSRIYIDGVAVGADHVGDGMTVQEDIANVNNGDHLQVYGWNTNGGSNKVTITNMRILGHFTLSNQDP